MRGQAIMDEERLRASAEACVANGRRILEETYDLEGRDPAATRFFLVLIAQEECAKAFLLLLIDKGLLPLSPTIYRTMNDHACKQLLGMIMDYVIMHWETIDELAEHIDADFDLGERFPWEIASALEILRYEKVGRWQGEMWEPAGTYGYNRLALGIAEGKADRRKQNALYVRIGRDGRVAGVPGAVSEAELRAELERAGRYAHLIDMLLADADRSPRLHKVFDAVALLFAAPAAPHAASAD